MTGRAIALRIARRRSASARYDKPHEIRRIATPPFGSTRQGTAEDQEGGKASLDRSRVWPPPWSKGYRPEEHGQESQPNDTKFTERTDDDVVGPG